ncbi:MAG: hypothetical protein HQ541_05185 [Mariniphaga sp.]|nr:hypothetical protein [Mariniphaga sp.]
MKPTRLYQICSPVILGIFLFINSNISIAQKVSVKVFPEIKRQKVVSIGGNYCQANYSDHAMDAVGEFTLNQFRPEYVRLALPLQFTNLDYADYKGEKIVQQPVIVELLESMQKMKNEFGVKNFTISVWRVADELVENPEKSSQRIIKPNSYDDVIDMIISFLLRAKNEFGVEADYFSFNESDGGWQTIFSPEATIKFIKKAGQRFEEAGLKTKFLWADTAQTKGTVDFATLIKADQSIWKYLGPLCFHSWWSEEIPNNEFEKIAGLAKAFNKPVWCSELGFDAHAHKTKGMKATWDYGLRFAKISHRMMKYAEVEVSMYWTWQNNYSIMSGDTKNKYPSYYVTRHLTEYLNKGTQIVHSLSSDPDILTISGIFPNGKKVLQIINMKNEQVDIEIEGFQSKELKLISTTESNLWEEFLKVGKTKKGKTAVQLKAQSVNTLVF